MTVIIMAALWNRAGHYIFVLWFLSICLSVCLSVCLSIYLSIYLSIQDAKIAKNSPSAHHRKTLSACIFATKACIECIDNRTKLVKQQYLHMSLQHGELRPTNG